MRTPQQKAASQARRRKMVAEWPPALRWLAYLLEFVLYIAVAAIVTVVALSPAVLIVWLVGKGTGAW